MGTLGVYLLWSGFGWMLLGLGLYLRRHWRERKERERARTAGEIVDYEEQVRFHRGGRSVTHYPLVRFSTESGQVRVKSDVSMDPEKHPVGSAVEVLYDADDPARFHLVESAPESDAGGPAIRIGVAWVLIATAATTIVYALSQGYGIGDIPYLLENSGVFHFLRSLFGR